MRGFWAALALAVCGTCAAGLPETPRFRQIGVEQGLPSSTVNALAQDRDGYLWVATEDGLARYDGVGFQVWRHRPGDPTALPGNVLQALHVDPMGRVWVGVEGQGIAVLGPDRREFRRYSTRTHPEMGTDDVFAIASTPNGSLWFGGFGGGLNRLDGDGSLHRFRPDPARSDSLPDDTVLSLAVTADGSLWVGTIKGAARWNGSGFDRVEPVFLSDPMVLSLSPDRDGSLWIGGRRGLDHWLPDGRVVTVALPLRPGQLTIRDSLLDRAGTRWLGTADGLVRVRDGVYSEVPMPNAGDWQLLAIIEDHEGGLWLGSRGQGLLQLPPGWRNFSVLSHRPGDETSLAPGLSKGMAPAGPGKAWVVGTGGALDRLDLRTGTVERVLRSGSLPGTRLNSVAQRRDGSVWIGHNGGLSRVDPVTREIRSWSDREAGPDRLLSPVTRLLMETPDGLLWMNAYGYGLQARDQAGRVVHEITAGDGRGLASGDPQQLVVGPAGALWVAGAQGVLRWNQVGKRFDPVPGAPAEITFGLAFEGHEVLWLHRLGALERYRWDGQRLELLESVGPDRGMPAVESGGVLVDRGGTVWLPTARGLVRYLPRLGQVRVFDVRDGLPSQEFDKDPPLITDEGIGLASSAAGLVVFDPGQIQDRVAPAKLVVESISALRANREVVLEVDDDLVRLGPNDREVKVQARLLSFADPGSHRYRFKVEGYDPDWVDTGMRGDRVVPQLGPGSYRIQVRAANAGGLWSNVKAVSLVVDRPWWLMSAALGGFGLVVLAGLGWLALAYRVALHRQYAWRLSRQRQQEAERMSVAKTRFLATLGHEIRTPMTGVLGMAELLQGGDLDERQRAQVEAIQRAGRHLVRLINDSLDLARIEAGRLTLVDAPFDLRALLAEVAGLLRPLASAKGLDFALETDPGLPAVLRGDVTRVRQVMLNLGHNAIKFSDQGEVRLAVRALSPVGIEISVHDQGPGLTPDQQARLFQRFEQGDAGLRYGGTGLGLAICSELATAMGGRIGVESEAGRGACFRVSLPLPATREAPPVARSSLPAPAPAGSPGLCILLVEDEAMVAEVVSGLLARQGHVVVHAANALAALAELRGRRFDLALMDLDLPGIDGLELARLIRVQNRSLPMVALTARADAEAEPSARAAGMVGFLRKPVTGEMLAQAIAEVQRG